jgi:hypothetical protein
MNKTKRLTCLSGGLGSLAADDSVIKPIQSRIEEIKE